MLENHGNFASSSNTENAHGNWGNVDRVLFKDLVEIVPLVESLMDKRENSSFSRRASVVYTPTPAQLKKVSHSRGRKTASAKKQTDLGNNAKLDGATDDLSNISSREVENIQKYGYELTLLRDQVDTLQKTLLEKEEALKSAEDSVNKMNTACASIKELTQQVAEKEALIKSASAELYNAKTKLADKQAALERLGWEAKTSNRKVEELQDDTVSLDSEITALMQIFEELLKNSASACPDDMITPVHYFEQVLPLELRPFLVETHQEEIVLVIEETSQNNLRNSFLEHLTIIKMALLLKQDQVDEIEMMKMEEARIRYLVALAAAKENPSDGSIALAAEARRRLQAFVF